MESPFLMEISLTGLPGFIIILKTILGYKILCSQSQVINMMDYLLAIEVG
jgi:hypothetical protein